MQETGIQHTTEVLAAGVALSLRTRNALADDGKISWLEGLGYLAELPKVATALKGIHEVPAELLDLDEFEKDGLADMVSETLTHWGVSHRVQDITKELMAAAVSLVGTLLTIKRLPPSAVPA